MKKRITLIVLSLLVAASVTACSKKTPETTEIPEENITNKVEVETEANNDANETSTTNTLEKAQTPLESNADIVKTLTPDGATDISEVPGSITLSSEKTLEELTAFYNEALKNINATKIQEDTANGTWGYIGTYDNGKPIAIGITPNHVKGSGMTVSIIYSDVANENAEQTEAEAYSEEPIPTTTSETTDTKDIAKILTPEGATVTAQTSGTMVLSSKKTLSELITFYNAALKDINAKQITEAEVSGTWGYTGTYNGDKAINVAITQDPLNDNGLTISIVY